MNIRKLAQGQDCTLRIPGVCNYSPETTVLAHVGRHGTAKRKFDEDAVFACSDCHDAIDYRTKVFLSNDRQHQIRLKEYRQNYIDLALKKTKQLIEDVK